MKEAWEEEWDDRERIPLMGLLWILLKAQMMSVGALEEVIPALQVWSTLS